MARPARNARNASHRESMDPSYGPAYDAGRHYPRLELIGGPYDSDRVVVAAAECHTGRILAVLDVVFGGVKGWIPAGPLSDPACCYMIHLDTDRDGNPEYVAVHHSLWHNARRGHGDLA